MRKFLLRFSIGFLISTSVMCFAQTCNNHTVTATIVDSDAQAWIDGTYTVSIFNPSGGQRPVCRSTGVPITTYYSGTLDGTGKLTISLPDTSAVDPIGIQWKFSIQPNASVSASVMANISVTANVDLSSQFSSQVIVPRFIAVNGSYGYNSTEAITPYSSGATFYNVIAECEYYYTVSTSSWNCGTAIPIKLQVNGINTISQILHNVQNGANISVTNPSGGIVQIDDTASTSNLNAVGPVYNVTNPLYAGGAKGDGRRLTTASYTAGNATVTVTGLGTAPYTAAPAQILVLKNAGLTTNVANITNCVSTLGTYTLTAANTFRGQEFVYFQNLIGCPELNNQILNVYSNAPTTPTATSFEVQFGSATDVSSPETATATQTKDLSGTIATVSGSDITGATVAGMSASMIPDVTATNQTVVWGTDDTAAIQATATAACTPYIQNSVGHLNPIIYFPAGDFHETGFTVTCAAYLHGQGSNATRLVYDGLNASTAHITMSGGGNSTYTGLDILADSYNFVPNIAFSYQAQVDNQLNFSDTVIDNFLTAGLSLSNTSGIVNLHFNHFRIDQGCGDFLKITVGSTAVRSNVNLSDFTSDQGSSLAGVQNCFVNSTVNFVTTSTQAQWASIGIKNVRFENQHGTQWGTNTAAWIKFSGGTTNTVPTLQLDNVTFNNLSGTSTPALIYADDATGANNPRFVLNNVGQGNTTTTLYDTASHTWCGGASIVQPYQFGDGTGYTSSLVDYCNNMNVGVPVAFNKGVSSYNQINLTGAGFAGIVATYNNTGLTANLSPVTLYTATATYPYLMVCANLSLITPGGSSSTLPAIQISYTENDDSVLKGQNNLTATSTGNTTSASAGGCTEVGVKAGSTVRIATAGYASSPAGMAYNIHATVAQLR